MQNPHDTNKQHNRREFVSGAARLAAAASLVDALAPSMGLSTNERADAWYDSKMAEREFVPASYGACISGGVKGYWSGGPGASAHTMYQALRGDGARVDPLDFRPSHPYDVDDFGRCAELLRAVPEWRARIGEMASVSPQWEALPKKWGAIEDAFSSGRTAKITELIRSAFV